MKVFEFNDYRAFIHAQIQANKATRGYQGLLAERAGCQKSFLSQVLNSHVELTPDHGANLCRFWGFDDDETSFFLALLSLSRASSQALKDHLKSQLQSMRHKKQALSERFSKPAQPEALNASVYYSSWHWGAVHMLVTIPGYQSPSEISRRLGISAGRVSAYLEGLEAMGFVRKEGAKWKPGTRNVHLPHNSPFDRVNQLNWRLRGLSELNEPDDLELHYTALYAAARRDLPRIRQALMDAIDASRSVVLPSPEEDLVCFACDFFRV